MDGGYASVKGQRLNSIQGKKVPLSLSLSLSRHVHVRAETRTMIVHRRQCSAVQVRKVVELMLWRKCMPLCHLSWLIQRQHHSLNQLDQDPVLN